MILPFDWQASSARLAAPDGFAQNDEPRRSALNCSIPDSEIATKLFRTGDKCCGEYIKIHLYCHVKNPLVFIQKAALIWNRIRFRQGERTRSGKGLFSDWRSLGPNIERRHVARVRFHSFFESNDWDHASLSGVCLARRNCDSAESGWMVGQAEVMARIGSAGITSGLPLLGHRMVAVVGLGDRASASQPRLLAGVRINRTTSASAFPSFEC